MNFDKGIIAIGFARQQRHDLVLVRTIRQRLKRCGTFVAKLCIAFHFGKLDQFNRSALVGVNFAHGADGGIKAAALAHNLFSGFGIVPQGRVFHLCVQLIKAAQCAVPIKRHLDQVKGSINAGNIAFCVGAHGETPRE